MSTRPTRQRPDTHSSLAQPLIAHRESLVPAPEPSTGPAAPATVSPLRPPRPPRIKRSVQLDPEIAARFDDVVLRLHSQHRIPKGQVVDALLTIAFDHLDDLGEEV